MKCADKDLLLYAVTDRYWLGERTLHDVVKESLDGGVTFVQLREKHLDQAHFLEEAKDLKMLCKSYNVPFVMILSSNNIEQPLFSKTNLYPLTVKHEMEIMFLIIEGTK